MYTSTGLVLALAFGAPGLKEPPAKDPAPDPLLGEWVTVSNEFGGKPVQFKPFNMEFKADGTLDVIFKGKLLETNRYKADSTKDPAQLDWQMPDANGLTALCIYKVEKDTLTLCADRGTMTRPVAFKSPVGSTVTVWTLKRVTKKE